MTDTPLPGKKARQAAESRARLIAEARALFQTQGYARTSTEGLLAATGLTRGALYHHFRDKKDLFAAVCAQMHAELGAAIEAATVDFVFLMFAGGLPRWAGAIFCVGYGVFVYAGLAG